MNLATLENGVLSRQCIVFGKVVSHGVQVSSSETALHVFRA